MNEIDEVLERIDVPATDPRADVARGERALRRRRGLQVSGAAVAVAAVALAGSALHGSSDDHADPGFAGQGGTAALGSGHRPAGAHHATHTPSLHRHANTARHRSHTLGLLPHPSVLIGYRDVLAEHLDPGGDRLKYAQNEQGGTGVIGTKLDWNGGGMLEIVVGHQWAGAGSFYDLETAGMTPTTFQGQSARVSSAGDDLVVSVQHDDGTVVTLIASTGFGNNGTSTSELGLTQQQLLAAAADPRLVMPS